MIVNFSGKSTFILALLRLLDPRSGTISVDGIDVSHTSRSAVRQTCFIAVPQDPFLLPDSNLRFNVDPMERYQDAQVVIALEKTRLWHHFLNNKSFPGDTSTARDISKILNSPLSSLPQLSTGQQQLISLARAVLRAQPPTTSIPYTDDIPAKIKPILLLDEATSSLDEETEAMIYEIIQQEFTDKGYTVIAISHRLSALAKGWKKGRDILMRMSNGRIEEVGSLGTALASGAGKAVGENLGDG
jgi:ATP-binding cassette subfamily C (CFTR/MRP) protein 1